MGPGEVIKSELRGFSKGGLVGIVLLKIPCSALQVIGWSPISTGLNFTREEGCWILKMTLWRTCASQEGSSVLKILHGFPFISWGGYSIFRERIQSPEWCLCSLWLPQSDTCGSISSWQLLDLQWARFSGTKKSFCCAVQCYGYYISLFFFFFFNYQKAVKGSECCAESQYVLNVALKHCEEEYRIF